MSTQNKPKRKGFLKGCLITVLILLVILGVAGGIGWSFLTKEHREAASLPLNKVDFDRLSDGSYHGVYPGGMYKWRYNECDVVVTGGKVTDIRLAATDDPGAENTDLQVLYDRVIQAQTLQVDTLTMATLTSKGYLQCVENALVPAQQN